MPGRILRSHAPRAVDRMSHRGRWRSRRRERGDRLGGLRGLRSLSSGCRQGGPEQFLWPGGAVWLPIGKKMRARAAAPFAPMKPGA